jgi:hypothetical protein
MSKKKKKQKHVSIADKVRSAAEPGANCNGILQDALKDLAAHQKRMNIPGKPPSLDDLREHAKGTRAKNTGEGLAALEAEDLQSILRP